MDAEMVGSAIRDYYTGKSYKQIAEGLEDEYGIREPSKATVYEWVRDYTELAAAEGVKHKATTGDEWVADETVVRVGGRKVWLWNVMDGKTRYILATHLTPDRDANAARTVLRKALAAADKPLKAFFSDKLRSYLSSSREVLPKAKHYQSEGFAADINNNLSERLQGTFKDRIKTLRGMDSIESGQRYLDGWAFTYNHFREHESLSFQTPGLRAKVKLPYQEWADVVKEGAAVPKLVNVVKAEAASPKPASAGTLACRRDRPDAGDASQGKVRDGWANPSSRPSGKWPPPVIPGGSKREKTPPRNHPCYKLRERKTKQRQRKR